LLEYFIQLTKAGEVSSHTYFEPSEMAKDCIQTNSSLEPFALGHKFDLHAYIILQIQRIISSTYIRGSSMLSPTYAKAAKCITTSNVFLENTE
jgi:hypothetical protein